MPLKAPFPVGRVSQPTWKVVLEAADQPIALQDEAGQYVFVNRPFLALLPDHGGDGALVLGRTDSDIFRSDSARKIREKTEVVWRKRTPQHWTQTVARGTAEHEGQTPTDLLLQFQAFLIPTANDSAGLLCLMARAPSANADEEFLALLSHELRSPLNAMVGWLQVMHSPRTTPVTSARALSGLDSAVQRQQRLAEQLLDASQIFSGRIRLDVTAVAIAPMLRKLVEVQFDKAIEKGFKVDLLAPGPSLFVAADPARLEESLTCIMEGIVLRARKDRTITVSAKCGHQHVDIDISDASVDEALPGSSQWVMADEERHRSIVSGYLGPGIGLTIAKALTELQGGALWLALAGQGEAVYARIRLPKASGPADRERLAGSLPGSLPHELPLSESAVLMLNHPLPIMEEITGILRTKGANVTGVDSVELAFEHYPQWAVCGGERLVLWPLSVDLENSIAEVTRLRGIEQDHGLPRIPIVALVLEAQSYPRRMLLAAGFDLALRLPIDAPLLMTALAPLLGR